MLSVLLAWMERYTTCRKGAAKTGFSHCRSVSRRRLGKPYGS
jgi:hypothetical protein